MKNSFEETVLPNNELENTSDVEKNNKIWEEIKRKNFSRVDELTLISDEIIEILLKQPKENGIFLSNLKSITDRQAERLSKYEGSVYLENLDVTDQQAEFLSKPNITWSYKYHDSI
ncbi:MAG: hypothetical protein WCW87_01870 [Candidatus Paceibacterota bacterium]